MFICNNDSMLFNLNNSMTVYILKNIQHYGNTYSKFHPYICFIICLVGTIINLIHFIVLTRKNLRKSSINSVMTIIAICDMITMLTYLIYNIHFRININLNIFKCFNPFSYIWILFLNFHVISSIFLHSLTLWLAVVMAFLRIITFKTSSFKSSWQNSIVAYKISFLIIIIVFITMIPNIIVHKILKTSELWNFNDNKEHCSTFDDNSTSLTEIIYTLDFSEVAKKNNCKIFKANLWLTGIFNKLIPSILLLLFSINLMYKLNKAQNKRKKFFYKCRKNSTSEKKFRKDKATTLLLGILVVFLVTELPQGFIIILSAIWTNDIFNEVYHYIADFLDLLSLINSSVNFFIYFIMSSRYRMTFINIVFRKNLGHLSTFSNRLTNSFFSREPTNYVSETVSKYHAVLNGTLSSYRKRANTQIEKNKRKFNHNHNYNDIKHLNNNSIYSKTLRSKKFTTSSEGTLTIPISDTSTSSSLSSLYVYSNLKKDHNYESEFSFLNVCDIEGIEQELCSFEKVSYL
uniref:G_PROTEIN_RECEP_F1_2 domain-containing protein n=1 Tax=Strongyloides stercoralis TaxID=6248 RepID=A0A0K0EQ66_STRER